MHVAADFIVKPDRVLELHDELVKSAMLRWRGNNDRMFDIGATSVGPGTTYLVRKKSRKRRSDRDLVVYSDRQSKPVQLPACHVELRLQRAASVRRQGVHRPADLLNINPRLMFAKNVALALFDWEDLRRRWMRAAWKDCQGSELPPSYDRASDKVRHFVSELSRRQHFRVSAFVDELVENSEDRAQNIHAVLPLWKPSVAASLLVPDTLCWPEHWPVSIDLKG